MEHSYSFTYFNIHTQANIHKHTQTRNHINIHQTHTLEQTHTKYRYSDTQTRKHIRMLTYTQI